jgi:hypothetical protein
MAGDAVEAVAAGHPCAGQLLLVAVVDEVHHRPPAERALDAEHLRLEQQRWPVGELKATRSFTISVRA